MEKIKDANLIFFTSGVVALIVTLIIWIFYLPEKIQQYEEAESRAILAIEYRQMQLDPPVKVRGRLNFVANKVRLGRSSVELQDTVNGKMALYNMDSVKVQINRHDITLFDMKNQRIIWSGLRDGLRNVRVVNGVDLDSLR
ncbi:hypothetical protein [Larkinella terrae]|uniref:Uncharacterized protein n=1 Tax=Larkinella terrae TaxID=2025311 RepID=A0A7K0EJ49_9BACT|nr:hypothetical protein [Larkinella terrae]MRS61762.1 hypothetical protein [Larkinella terrae]